MNAAARDPNSRVNLLILQATLRRPAAGVRPAPPPVLVFRRRHV